ncbi:hypothetical protein N7523_010033 [Penicillium sp. IBT 18751x]|nr:hypothetical protein N7523_010033 [Penicillium sp. IBT 18751x]
MDQEVAANLTPPSTPPPKYPAEVVDTPCRQSPEPGESARGQSHKEKEKEVEAEPTAEPEEEDAKPAEEQPADTEVEPAQEDWSSPSHIPLMAMSRISRDSWPEDEVEEQHDESQPPSLSSTCPLPNSPTRHRAHRVSACGTNSLRSAIQQRADLSAHGRGLSSNDLPYLTFHAKVYVFATRHLIPALAWLCLQKLHRNLL